MTVLIPAYEPDLRLIELIRLLKENCDYRIVVVDDGSGVRYRYLFDMVRSEGCTVLAHETNRGKGCALKTGFSYILEQGTEKTGVVTADADGQHLVLDILRVAQEIPSSSRKIVLGARKFVGKVPLRSAFGNFFMRIMFTAASGSNIWDTQTGLRGFPVSLLPLMLKIEGDRFEYEMEMLLEASSSGYGFKQISIETLYIAGNRSSHFHPFRDSVRVCIPFFKFCLSGITAAVVDYSLLFVFQWLIGTVWRLPGALFFGVVLARASSSGVNFAMNRALVFRSKATKQKPKVSAAHYYLLVCSLLLINYLMLKLFTDVFHIWLVIAKILTEVLLFFFSYGIQRFLLFKNRPAVS